MLADEQRLKLPSLDGHNSENFGDTALASAIQTECLRRGLIIELGGRHGCVVRFLPPLTITESEMVHVVDIFAAALRAATLRE